MVKGHGNLRRDVPDNSFRFLFPGVFQDFEASGYLLIKLLRFQGNAQSEAQQEAAPRRLGADRAHAG